jgi:hypothetical protein
MLRRYLGTFVVIWTVSGLPGRAAAAADDAAAKTRANTLLAEARQLYDGGDYGGALTRLNQAYTSFPSPLILFNFGQVYRALLRDVEAIEAFDQFLATSDDQNPSLRHEAEVNLIELSRRVGTIEIVADADQAEVSVDGRVAGRSPLKRGVRIVPGSHQIVVLGPDGTIPFVRRIEIAAGETARVQATTARLMPATIAAGSAPPPEQPALYRRWWFWAGLGAVVAGAVITTVALASGSSSDDCKYNGGCIPFP